MVVTVGRPKTTRTARTQGGVQWSGRRIQDFVVVNVIKINRQNQGVMEDHTRYGSMKQKSIKIKLIDYYDR